MLSVIGLIIAALVTWGINPVYSILTLITSALSLGFTLLIVGLEFISFLIILIYIGAVAVLFLFVVMMINFKTKYEQVFLIETFVSWFIISLIVSQSFELEILLKSKSTILDDNNLHVVGSSLYSSYNLIILGVISLTLFIAMVGAISLTYVLSENHRSQNIPTQMTRASSVYTFNVG